MAANQKDHALFYWALDVATAVSDFHFIVILVGSDRNSADT